MWTKICGMTRLQDARYAEQLGVDAIGFIFAPSQRHIKVRDASLIARHVRMARIGVFVNQPPQEVQKIAQAVGLDMLQLHGEEACADYAEIGLPIIKAVRVKTEADIQRVNQHPGAWKILLDTWSPHQHGGTGRRIADRLLASIENFDNIILAGGLDAESIAGVIERYHPFGIDVNSRVESAPGIKDHKKCAHFITQMRKTCDN